MAVPCLRFFAGHLLVKGQHGRAFFATNHRAALVLVLRTTLRLAGAALAVPPFRFVPVIREAFHFRVLSGVVDAGKRLFASGIPLRV